LARLSPGVSVEQVRAELAVVTQRLAELYPDANRDTGATVSPLRGEYSDRSRLLLLGLAGASVCILVIACANLGSLLLARGLARERELAVRTALGAGRERLVRQLVTESLVIAGTGSVVGILAAMASLPLLARLVPATLPLAGGPVLDLRVLGSSIVLTVATSLAFAVFPARRTAAGSGSWRCARGARPATGERNACAARSSRWRLPARSCS
jgi:ABC-type antimicrobial peptide transport system permease subunit